MTVSANHRQALDVVSWLVPAAFGITSFWDVYVAGVRPLDLGVFCLLGATSLLVTFRWGEAIRSRLDLVILFVVLNAYFAVLGFAVSQDNLKPVTGYLMGLASFLVFYFSRPSQKKMIWLLNGLIVVNAGYITAQYAYFLATGQVINLFAPIGLTPRALSNIFRPTGFYLEPASHSLAIVMLMVLRMKYRPRFDRYVYLGVASLFVSLSLWGAVVGLLSVLFYNRRRLTIGLVVALGLSFAVASLVATTQEYPLIRRIFTLGADSSAQARYGLWTDPDKIWDFGALFGSGVSYDYLDFGSSGYAFLLKAGGAFGCLAFLGLVWFIASRRERVHALFFILLCMTGGPLWTYVFWWGWLALLLKTSDQVAKPMAVSRQSA